MSYAIAEPSTDPRDTCDRAADEAEITRQIAVCVQLGRITIGETQVIGPEGEVLCLWCHEALEPERLAAEPSAVRHESCQEDYEQWQRRHR